MIHLTKAEEQVMKVLWEINGGLLMQIVDKMPKPQPHKNTVATVLKTLVSKGVVETETVGRFFRYYPLVTRKDYCSSTLATVAKGYFAGSFKSIVSFLVDDKKLDINDLELLMKQIKKAKK